MTKLIGAPTLDDALAALGREVARNEREGRETLVFCEDRLTLLAERAVLRETGGTFSCEVATFARYLGGADRMISKYGSVMALTSLIEANADKLRCFGTGAAQAVYETLAQLLSSRIDADMLASSAAETEGMLQRKLTDLSFLLAAYGDFLHEKDLLDENGYLALLPSAIEKNRPDAVIFFGFPSFTKQAREGVRAAICSARSVTGIFLAGRGEIYTNEAAHVFRLVAEEFGSVDVSLEKSSLTGEANILLGELFTPEAHAPARPAEGIFAFETTGQREEYETVAALIRREIAQGRRYRDITVLAGSAEDYPAAGRALSAYGIPYYLDRRRKFSEHPFCVFALSVLDAAANGGLKSSLDDIASSVYFGDDGRYRNYLAALGGRYVVKRDIKKDGLSPEDADMLTACREKMLKILKLVRAKDTGRGYAEAIDALWKLVDGERITDRLKEASPEDAAFLDVSKLSAVLQETTMVAGGDKFTARQFYNLFKNGLEAYEISMLPRYADAVFVGDIGESRIYRSPVLFLTGLTDGVPRITPDTAVVTDGEIKKLAVLGAEIEPAIAVVNRRTREAVALNACSFSETLYLSRPLKLQEETAPSELFFYVGRTFSLKPLPPLFPYDCSAYSPALAASFSCEDPALREALRAALMQDVFGHGMPVDPEAIRLGLEKKPVAEAEALYFSREISPTLLETYFDCPYKSFATRALRLEERKESPMDAADAGTFMHAVLAHVAEQSFPYPDEDACGAEAETFARELLKRPEYAALTETASGIYAAERLAQGASRIARTAYRQLKGSNFRVRAPEAEVTLPALNLRGKVDRVDETDTSVRIIDYKTGRIKNGIPLYYMGRKLQLQLYLLAAKGEKRAAGAFYFPATDEISSEETKTGRMTGFFSTDEETMSDMDPQAKGASEFYVHSRDGSMEQDEFEDFLTYSLLIAEQGEEEMRAGNICPSPSEGACSYCRLKGACGFTGTARQNVEIDSSGIAEIVRNETNGGSKP